MVFFNKLDIHRQNMHLDLNVTPYIIINLKWIIDLNVNCETVKLLKENIGTNLQDLGLGGNFLDTTPKAWHIFKNQNIGLPQN